MRSNVTVRPGTPILGLADGRILRPQDAVRSSKKASRIVDVTRAGPGLVRATSTGRRSARWGSPAVGQELVELAVVVRVDPREDVGDVVERVDRICAA